MDLTLTPELVARIRSKVDSGRYPSEAEVIRAALWTLEERERVEAETFESLRRDIQIGLDQIERGEYAPLDMDEIEAEVEARINAQASSD